VDTHPDLNTIETSPSGNIHGMVLAGLLGRGSEAMLQTTNACQTLDAHVAMVGVRSADEGEQRWLDEGKIHCMTMDVVREQGLETCMSNAIQTANKATAGYGLTIDIDALDPKDAPFVATPVADGLDTTDLITALASIEDSQRLLGMEVVEFTPHQDSDTAVACDLIYSLVTAVTGVAV
jgi:arginase